MKQSHVLECWNLLRKKLQKLDTKFLSAGEYCKVESSWNTY